MAQKMPNLDPACTPARRLPAREAAMRRPGERRRQRRRAEQLLTILELRAQYLELLAITVEPGLLLHIVDTIDRVDEALDAFDPDGHLPRSQLVSVPRR